MTGKALAPAPRYSAVERAATASPPPLPSLSGGLKSAIADSLNLVPATLDGESGHVWQPPGNLPARIIDEAKRVAQALERALWPAGAAVKGRWLSQLAQLVAPGRDGAPDMLARVNAMARDLDHPPLCFTDETRVRAAKAFTFFPSFAELAGLLDGIRQPYRERLERLRRLVPAQQPERVESEAERDARGQAMEQRARELGAMLRGERPWPDGSMNAQPKTESPQLKPLHVDTPAAELMARVGGCSLGEIKAPSSSAPRAQAAAPADPAREPAP